MSTYYLGLNRNKRSRRARPRRPGGRRARAASSRARADVLVESFRPGLMARWGLDHADVAARRNPRRRLLLGHGVRLRATPGAGMPGYDLLLQAVSGLMSVTGEPDGRPLKVGAALIDLVCGLSAANGDPRRAARARAHAAAASASRSR